MKKKIMIIGATGSTGLYLTEELRKKDYYEIIAIGRKKRKTDYYKKNNIQYFALDISKKESFIHLPKDNIAAVILLAGIMPARMKGYDPYRYIDINITGTLNVLEFCRVNSIPQLMFALSHSDVYGYWNTNKYIKDDVQRIINFTGDHAVYIISKIAASDLIEHYHQEYNIQTVVFRMPTIYAYWPDDTFYVNGVKQRMAYLTFIKKAIAGDPIEVWGNPHIVKDIVYVKDFIQMVEKAIGNPKAQGIYNVGTGIPVSLEEQIKGVIDVFCDPRNRSKLIYRPDKPSQISYLYDITKAKKDLGYIVQYPYKKMLFDIKKEMNNPIFDLIKNG